MSEAAAAVAAPAAPAASPVAPAAAVTPSAGAALTSVPTGEWANGFKNQELKAYVADKKFTDPEQLAERYQSLEKKLGVPADRLLRLPEKMEGDEAKAIWERLGAPKEAKGYELAKDKADADPQFTTWAEGMFHKNNLTKAQAIGVVAEYEAYAKAQIASQTEARSNAMKQADVTLKKEWGPHYEANINICSQGAKILGLDKATLDTMEAIQGREKLFKTLQKIGASVGESAFVDGGHAPTTPTLSAEEASQKLKDLQTDKKFAKKLFAGNVEARAEWDRLNKLAAPGEKQIG